MNVLFRGTEIPIRETDTKVKEVGSEIRNGMYGRLGRLPWWLRWQRIFIKGRKPGFIPWVRKILWRRE